MLSREWRCSWSSADRRCSNYIWVIDNFIAYYGTTYIRDLTVICINWRQYTKFSNNTQIAKTIRSTSIRNRCRSEGLCYVGICFFSWHRHSYCWDWWMISGFMMTYNDIFHVTQKSVSCPAILLHDIHTVFLFCCVCCGLVLVTSLRAATGSGILENSLNFMLH